jgi:DNA-binding beta-propeller fold protein YncE
MRNQRCEGFLLSAFCATIVAAPATAQTDQVARIIQTNSAGTNAHIIDPETHEVLAVVEGVPHVHGVAEHPEDLYYYVSNEMHSTIDVVDTRTLEVVDPIPLSGRTGTARSSCSMTIVSTGPDPC